MVRTIATLGIALIAAAAAVADPVTVPLTGRGVSGRAVLTDAPNGVLLRVSARGLAPGWHAIHFHEKGDCSDAAFKGAGAHVHGDGATVHGLLNAAATDRGDLPNIYAGADGAAEAELFSPLVALRDGTARPNLRDADGSAVIVHAQPDDHLTQPIGGAGARVACAVVR